LPPSFFHWMAGHAVNVSNHIAIRFADVVVTNTESYAQHSPILSQFRSKIHVIPTPVEIPEATPKRSDAFRSKFRLDSRGPIIGIVARLASEKGFEYLFQAMPYIIEQFPGVSILHIGPREPVGEAAYARRLAPLIERHRNRYRYLGVVSWEELAAFYAICDVFVLPSVNSTESFGMVQVEAAMCGTPSVASDLPGVREATRLTGMGLTATPRDPRALAEAICQVLSHPQAFTRPREQIAKQFSPASIAARYELLFEHLLQMS
ncbi:MAG: glycosyltransferase family 4 protein, partial [Chloroflexota bacterium]|nr:glycosyltransferase family 4 protein [Chloroflexota bacterium]